MIRPVTVARVIYDRHTGSPIGEDKPGRLGRWYVKRADGTITPARWFDADEAEEALREGKA